MKKLLLSFLCCMLAVIGMQAAEVTYTVNSTTEVTVSAGTAPAGSSNTYQSTYNTKNQLTAGNSMTLTLSGYDGCTITGITLSMRSNSSKGAGSFTAKAGDTTISSIADSKFNETNWHGEWSTSYVDVTPAMTNNTYVIGEGENVVLTIAATTNSLYCQSFTITYEPAAEQPGEGGEVVTVEVPTFTPVSGTEFDEESLNVTINVEEGLKAFYSIGNEENYIEGTTLTVVETTTVYAYAQDAEGNKSNVVSAKYTKKEPLAENTIVFNNTDGSDGSQVAETSDFVTTYIKETNIEGLTCTATSKCYKGKAGYGIKLGSSSANGSFTLQLSSAMNVESIVVNAVKYNNDEASLSVNGSGAQSLTAEFANYTFEINKEINEITVSMTKRGYIKSLTINVANGETPGDDPVDPTPDPEDPVEPTPDPDMYTWILVDDANSLSVNDQVVIVATESDKALSTTQNSNNRGAQSITKDASEITIDENVQVLTLEQGTVEGSWAFYTGDGYLYAASGSSNHLKTQATKDDNGSWNVTIADGVASIVAQGENTRNVLKYNSQSNLFSCYGENNTQKNVSLYRKEVIENITSGNCYNLAVGAAWEEPEGCWYAAKFINANTGEYTWSVASDRDDENIGYIFYLAPGNTPLGHEPQLDPDFKYTHVEFVQLPATVEEPADIRTLDLTGVEYTTTGVIWYDGVSSKTYSIAEKAWMAVGTGLNRVELADGIGYAYGVVSAEGAIEVYNVNGAVVARGNDNVDLRGLGRGVYIIRNGNQVRKVVR